VEGGRTVAQTTTGKGKAAGVLGAAVGVIAAGTAVGFTLERLTIGRAVRRMAAIHDPGEPFGTLRGDPLEVRATDGINLYVEIDEPRGLAGGGRLAGAGVEERAAGYRESAATRPTLLFTHGFCLPQDCWHFQRAEFSATHRMVFWDQRGHGRSDAPPRGRSGRGVPVTVEQLGEDLYAVLEAACPDEPVVLVGHSMGGMTMMALAAQHPELFGERIVGTALLSTSAGRFEDVVFGLPRPSAKLLHRATPAVLDLLARQTGLVERGRALGGDLALVLTRRYAFGSEVPESVVRFTQELIQSVPIDVIADFYSIFSGLDLSESVPVFDRVPSLVLAGANDLMLPVAHSEALAAAIPTADYVVVPDAGHAVILERPDAVGEALRTLVDRVEDRLGSTPGTRAAQ
jgi:pimeloyl-ACP methyl ester carboxylesterase